ncbi:MAG: pyridoxal-phosphate dependent enzyme, partial [Pyrinomonadaceae bacterium]
AKRAIADADLQKKVFITSANSINVARWLPQQFYYFYALKQWQGEPPVISVPSGNFGNLASGVLAHISGLPVKNFIAACNSNDVVPQFFESGEYKPKPSVSTLSNAMDVGDPSNFVRILEIFGQDFKDLKEKVEAVSISDEQTAETMRCVKENFDYVLDPHGAVAFRALSDHLEKNPGENGIILETAHPVKFDSVTNIIGEQVMMPESVSDLFSRKKVSTQIGPDYETLKEILLERSK